MQASSITELLRQHREEWLSIPGVVGTGIGECDGLPCIKLFVAEETPQLLRAIPDSVGGYTIKLEITGQFRTQEPDGK